MVTPGARRGPHGRSLAISSACRLKGQLAAKAHIDLRALFLGTPNPAPLIPTHFQQEGTRSWLACFPSGLGP